MKTCCFQVSAFRPWINCVVTAVGKGLTKAKIDKYCDCVEKHQKNNSDDQKLENFCSCRADSILREDLPEKTDLICKKFE